MRNINLFNMILFFATSILSAQPEIVNQFEKRSHTYNETTLPYRLFVPTNYDSTKHYPLVLTLHGSGERGSDNEAQISGWRLATAWADPLNQVKYPCFVVSPQCPAQKSWAYDFRGPIGAELENVLDILDSLSREFTIDENRLYITGLSMGGFGTFDLIQRFPDRFAAAVPMSSGGDSLQASKIVDVPIWNFHGKIDDNVSVEASRWIIEALQKEGERVVYTHNKYDNPTGLIEEQIDMYVQSHQNLFYTEYENGGHVIWDESYDYPYLFPWVFSQYKRTKGAIQLINFKNYRTLSNNENIEWNAITTDGTVEIWFSPDAGTTWLNITESAPNTGSYLWDTSTIDDIPFGLLKIFLKNEKGFIYALDESAYFAINSIENGKPFVRILNDEFDKSDLFEQTEFKLNLLAGDPEFDQLTVNYYYKQDLKPDFILFKSDILIPDTLSQNQTIDLTQLPNSTMLELKVEVLDGDSSDADTTYHFSKRNERQVGQEAVKISGNSSAIVTPLIINADQLTGDLYRITFDDTTFAEKVYNIKNMNTGQNVVQNASPMDGVAESPYFEGMRVIINDFTLPVEDVEHSSWEVGATELTISAFLPSVNIGGVIYKGIPNAFDYQIKIFDEIMDSSNAAFGIPPVPMKFTIKNITINKRADLIFIDTDKNQSISRNDIIYLLNLDDPEDPQLTWAFTLTGDGTDMPPQPGDIYNFYTLKPLTANDSYEFTGVVSAIVDNKKLPVRITLFPNFPNPFNPSTTIHYYLPQTAKVEIKIYNVLGQTVNTIFNGVQDNGEKFTIWNGQNDLGQVVSSGVYFYTLKSGNFFQTRKMLLLR